jgi:hypothetical protein
MLIFDNTVVSMSEKVYIYRKIKNQIINFT